MDNQSIDENLYSRQLYVLGKDAMMKMNNSKILVIGLKGLGAEITKDVVLGGVKSLTLFDNSLVTLNDLSSQFFLNEGDIGKPISEICLPRIQELNNYVHIDVFNGEITEATISQFDVIVLTDSKFELALKINEVCRSLNIKIIYARTAGLFGMIFNDFGRDFEILDTNGEPLLSTMIASIIQHDDYSLDVTCLDETRHGMEDGDYVCFKEVQGLDTLNTYPCPLKIQVTGPYTFKVPEFDLVLPVYTNGGIVSQVKMPKLVTFKSLHDSLEAPDFLISDFAKFDRPKSILTGFQAIDMFLGKHNRLPAPRNLADAKEIINLAQVISGKDNEVPLQLNVLAEMAYQSQGDVPSMQSFIGSMAAQEVMKACSGKFTPIHQIFTFDSLESLPPDLPTEQECQPVGTRYDAQLCVFGAPLMAKIYNLKYFLVGAGAIGCEMLKNWALMGLSTGPNGMIYITDMDTIEKSNLNRQFLFRPWDVSKFKSETAANATRAINKDINVVTYQDRVGEQTESIYNAEFYESLDGVANALDNVESRRYIDSRCVLFRKSLIESGTLGTKGNVQIVIPHISESYSSSQDPPEKSIPICTLKNFPSQVEHTIQWGRDLFEGLFTKNPENVNIYLSDTKFIDSLLSQNAGDALDTLESIVSLLVINKPTDFNSCIIWARNKFQDLFYNQIAQLLFNFPPDQITSTGAKFWSPPKRCPSPIVFDGSSETHLDFIISAAHLYANMFKLNIPSSSTITNHQHRQEVYMACQQITIPPFIPKTGIKIQVNENEKTPEQDLSHIGMNDEKIDSLIKQLPRQSDYAGYKMQPIAFEKDDDTNYHIDFVTATSNLRSINYGIPTADKFKTKGIAGKIIPAIATTTSAVVGLGCLELYKLASQNSNIEAYKNSFVNLALPFIGFSEPMPALLERYYDISWSLWDRFDVPGPITLSQFIEYFEKTHKFSISMVSYGVGLVYSDFMPSARQTERLSWSMKKCVEDIMKKPLPIDLTYIYFDILPEDQNGNELNVPTVRYRLNE